jgi:hypothetical protein
MLAGLPGAARPRQLSCCLGGCPDSMRSGCLACMCTVLTPAPRPRLRMGYKSLIYCLLRIVIYCEWSRNAQTAEAAADVLHSRPLRLLRLLRRQARLLRLPRWQARLLRRLRRQAPLDMSPLRRRPAVALPPRRGRGQRLPAPELRSWPVAASVEKRRPPLRTARRRGRPSSGHIGLPVVGARWACSLVRLKCSTCATPWAECVRR